MQKEIKTSAVKLVEKYEPLKNGYKESSRFHYTSHHAWATLIIHARSHSPFELTTFVKQQKEKLLGKRKEK